VWRTPRRPMGGRSAPPLGLAANSWLAAAPLQGFAEIWLASRTGRGYSRAVGQFGSQQGHQIFSATTGAAATPWPGAQVEAATAKSGSWPVGSPPRSKRTMTRWLQTQGYGAMARTASALRPPNSTRVDLGLG